MQITLTLDSDVAALLRSAMHETGAPIERVLNTALREGLLPSKPKGSAISEPFRQITFDMGDELGVSNPRCGRPT